MVDQNSGPSPEAVRLLQGFFLSRMKKHHVRVIVETGIGTDNFDKETFDMQFTNQQLDNFKDLMKGMVQETNKDV